MLRKTSEQEGVPGYQVRTVVNIGQTCVLYVPIPAGLYAGDGEQWFHFQGNLPTSLGAFLRG